MTAYVFANNGQPIFDTTGAVIILNSAGQPVDHVKNMVTITNADGVSNGGASPPRATPQPDIPVIISSLI